jgi:O-antigen/teichoic acid export membrane protein
VRVELPSLQDPTAPIPRWRPLAGRSFAVSRAAIGSLGLYAASNLLALLTAVWLGNLLGVEGYGIYAYGIAWANVLVAPAALGLDRFVVRGVATYRAADDRSALVGLLRFASRAVLAASLIVGAAALVVGAVVLPGDVRTTFLLSTALIPLFALTLVRQAAMQGLRHVVLGQMPEFLLRPALLLLGIGACVLIGGWASEPAGIMAATLVASVLSFAVGTAMLLSHLPADLARVKATIQTRRWLRAALPMMLIGGIWLLNPYVSSVILGSLSGGTDVGLFTVASRAAALVLLPLWAVNAALSPRIAGLAAPEGSSLAGRGPEALQEMATRGSRLALAAALPIAAALVLFREPLLGIFGGDFSGAALPLSVLVAGQLVNVATGPSQPLLLMTGHERTAAWVVGAGVALNVGLNFLAIGLWGLNGCAIATAASNIAWNVALVVVAIRVTGVNPCAISLRWVTRGAAPAGRRWRKPS